MNPERFQQIEQLYHSTLKQQPDHRGAFLAAACGGDEDLRREVEALLAQSGATEDLVDPTAWETVTMGAKQVGAYRILSRLGAGGMGEVYGAADKAANLEG